MEDDASMLNTQEMAQQQLVYMTNLENDLQNHGTKMNKEEGPKDRKPAAKNKPLERPSQINLNHGSKLYEESGSENNNVEEKLTYSNIGSYKRGEQVKQWKIEKHKNDHEIPRNQEKNETAPVTKEMNQGNDSFQSGKEHFYR